ncbi:MAG: CobW-like GTP-binding protein [Mariniblastus sp.]|nr:CobW-like GTP-binding protein [Mariniblastus sp.]
MVPSTGLAYSLEKGQFTIGMAMGAGTFLLASEYLAQHETGPDTLSSSSNCRETNKMQTNPRFIMIGGFLGAGKTTTVGRLANHYRSQGKNIIIVTNDQASDLVDTHTLRSQGFQVGEVAGSCFCCNFNELTDTVEKLGEDQRPDVILAEPVGSCTDLVATVIRPLQDIYSQPLDIAPYGVILKPSHGARILSGKKRGGFSPQANYIFRKQLEEADFVLLNRIDELSEEEVTELTTLIEEQFEERPVLRISAKTGDGFEGLCTWLEQRGHFGQRVLDIDYEVYAAGEAELGWLNCQVGLVADKPFDLDQWLVTLLKRLQDEFDQAGAETAHLKVIGMSEGFYTVANLVSSGSEPTLSLPSGAQVTQAQLVINARVAIDPERLADRVRSTVQQTGQQGNVAVAISALQSFRPGRPVPTHRMADG